MVLISLLSHSDAIVGFPETVADAEGPRQGRVALMIKCTCPAAACRRNLAPTGIGFCSRRGRKPTEVVCGASSSLALRYRLAIAAAELVGNGEAAEVTLEDGGGADEDAAEDDGDTAAEDPVDALAAKSMSHSPPNVLAGTTRVHSVLLSSSFSALSAAAGGPPPPNPAPYPGIPGWLNSMPSVSVENIQTAPI